MDFEKLIEEQRKFFRGHSTKKLEFRRTQLRKLRDLLRTHENELYSAIEADFGKSKFDTYSTELSFIFREIDFYLKKLPAWIRPKKVRTGLSSLPGKSRIYYEPLGCCLIIGAWNYPYQLTLLPAIAALAAGNTVIIKPSELTPECAALMARMINDSFSKEYFHVVPGGAEETTELLKYHFDHVFFTGSPRVGRMIYEAAARHLTPVTLELGGKSPAIVCETANLEVAARRIVWGKFLNAGQTCIAPDYLLVHKKVHQRLLELMEEQILQFDYRSGSTHYPGIINRRHFDRLKALIDPGKIYRGHSQNIGKINTPDDTDYARMTGRINEQELFIAPTMLVNVEWEDPCMQEEIFGPILPVLTFEDLDKLLARLIALEKPLAAYLFSNNRQEQQKFTGQFSFGGGCINDTLMHISNTYLPFGGVGKSGMGHYHGRFGFETFSHAKSVLHKANWGEPSIKYPPYSKGKLKWIRRLLS